MEWRTVSEAPEYEVSADGVIRSIYTSRPLKGGTDKDGYRRFVLCTGGGRIHRRLAPLVCEAFHGPRPSGYVVRHLDGTRDNDAASNLSWSTQRVNVADKIAHGTSQRGERHGMSKLTTAQVLDIRAAVGTCRDIGKRFGIASCTVSAIKTRRLWSHLP